MKTAFRLGREIFRASPMSAAVFLLCTFAVACLPTALTLASASLFDAALLGGGNPSRLLALAFLYLLLVLAQDLFGGVEGIVRNEGIFERGSMRFRSLLVDKTSSLPLIEYENVRTLEWFERAGRAVREESLPRLFCQYAGAAGSVLSIIGIAAAMSSYMLRLSPARRAVVGNPALHRENFARTGVI